MKKSLPHLFILLVLLIPLFFLGIGNHGLWTPDEPRVAEIGREMSISGNWAVPTLNRESFLEKPPLHFWLIAGTFSLSGQVSELLARLPSALAGLGGALITFFLAGRVFGRRTGLLSAFILATSGEYLKASHRCLIDPTLTLFLTTAMALFLAACLAGSPRKSAILFPLGYVCLSLAFLAKGFIGLAIPAAGLILFLLLEGNLKMLLKMKIWLGAILFLLLVSPWLVGLWQKAGREGLNTFFVINNWLRFFGGGPTSHRQPFYYYMWNLPLAFLPWSLLLVPFLLGAQAPPPLCARERSARRFLVSWFLGGFLLLSIASTKRNIYLLPLFPPLSILTARWIDRTISEGWKGRVEELFLWIFWALAVLAGTGLPIAYWGLGGESILLPAGFLCAGAILSLLSLQKGRTKNGRGFWMTETIHIFCLALCILLLYFPLIDQKKSFKAFCEGVQDRLSSSASGEIYAYHADETLKGIIPFYTGLYVKNIESQEALRTLLKSPEEAFLVIMDKRGKVEQEVLSAGPAFPLMRMLVGNRRTCILFSNQKREERSFSGMHDPLKEK